MSPQLRNLQIVIRPENTPSGKHAGGFNTPTIEDVAVIMVGEPVDNRAIKITRRYSTVYVIQTYIVCMIQCNIYSYCGEVKENVTSTLNSLIRLLVRSRLNY